MKTFGHSHSVRRPKNFHPLWQPVAILAVLVIPALRLSAQTAQPSIPAQIQQLTSAMERTQAQLKQSQQQLDEMRTQLAALQQQMAQQQGTTAAAPATDPPAPATDQPQTQSAELENIRERQAMQEAQIATQEQSKVESESKYPVKITGLLLFNGFVNTSGVTCP